MDAEQFNVLVPVVLFVAASIGGYLCLQHAFGPFRRPKLVFFVVSFLVMYVPVFCLLSREQRRHELIAFLILLAAVAAAMSGQLTFLLPQHECIFTPYIQKSPEDEKNESQSLPVGTGSFLGFVLDVAGTQLLSLGCVTLLAVGLDALDGDIVINNGLHMFLVFGSFPALIAGRWISKYHELIALAIQGRSAPNPTLAQQLSRARMLLVATLFILSFMSFGSYLAGNSSDGKCPYLLGIAATVLLIHYLEAQLK